MIHQFHQKSSCFGYNQSIKKLQLLPQSFFITEAKEAQKNIAIKDYVTDNNSSFDKLEMINDEVNQRAILNCMEEEADSWLILHVANARTVGFTNFLVLPNNCDVPLNCWENTDEIWAY